MLSFTQKKPTKICSLARNNLPSFTPIIYGLSQTKSNKDTYTIVYIIGENFFQNGTTYVNFGNIKKIPITYYSSFNISFIVPPNVIIGDYSVTVVNIYTGNLSLPVQYTYTPNLNTSNSIMYNIL
jgi:hypothetical protein